MGAFAKGYAAEMVCRSLQKQGFTHALISVGGSTRAIGTKPGGSQTFSSGFRSYIKP